MTLQNTLRRAANYGRKVADKVYQRPTTVTIRVITYSGNVGVVGVTEVSTANTTLVPSPKVVPLGQGLSSVFGNGAASQSAGRISADTYRIGPITPPHSSAGYSVSDLAPTGATTKRVLIFLEGDDFGSGELYQITTADFSKAQSYYLEVQRAAQ